MTLGQLYVANCKTCSAGTAATPDLAYVKAWATNHPERRGNKGHATIWGAHQLGNPKPAR